MEQEKEKIVSMAEKERKNYEKTDESTEKPIIKKRQTMMFKIRK